MKRNKILGVSCGVLAGLAGLQMMVLSQRTPSTHVHASWKYRPTSIAAAQKDAEQIVQGRVVKIERAQDICVAAKGEPGGKDCIPNEVVTLALEGAYKGDTPQLVQVYHTGISPISAKGRKMDPRPKDNKHGGQPIKNSKIQNPSAMQRNRYVLDDDPQYRVGQQLAMFLGKGPQVTTQKGAKLQTMTPLNPALRMEIKGGKLFPVTTRHKFAKDLRGKPSSALRQQLPTFKARPFKDQAPQLQKMRLTELQRSNKTQEFNRLLKELPAQQLQRLKLQPMQPLRR